MKPYRSLRFKLTVWYMVIIGSTVGLAGLYFYKSYEKSRLEELDRELRAMAADILEVYWKTDNMPWPDAIRKAEADYRVAEPLILVVRFPDRRERDAKFPAEVFRSSNAAAREYYLGREAYFNANHALSEGRPFLTVSLPPPAPAKVRAVLMPSMNFVLQVGVSLGRVADEMRRFLALMLLAGGLLLVMASAGGNFILRKALRPVKSVTRAAREISAEDLSLRIAAKHPQDEIGELVATFNDMIARLERSVAKIRQFSGDVSHELRTPLTVIRGEVEVQLRKARTAEEYRATLASVLEETGKLEGIINDLLILSRVEAGGGGTPLGPAALDEAVMEAFESREKPARDKGLEYVLEKVESVSLPGDKGLLERLAVNLIDNAVRYTPAGGRVSVSLKSEDGRPVLRVRDTGIGIPESALPNIFDRFVVVDESRSKETGGAGLGLAIVKSIADLHGAAVDVRSRAGEGSEFVVRFPAA